MAQDTTPAIVIYQGDGSTNVFSIPFDKGYYGEVKVAFVRRGLTDYTYNPDTYENGAKLYAWCFTDSDTTLYVYTRTPIPAVNVTHIYDEYGNETESIVTSVEGESITINYDEYTVYTRDSSHDIEQHQYLTWTGDTLEVGDYICIVRETENSQPFVYPANQKHIENALDNLERQIQEIRAITDHALIVDPIQGSLSPIDWMETITRCMDLSVRELRYNNGWLQYSLVDPKASPYDKTWHNLLNTTNIKSIYYKYSEDEETGRPLYNVYYVDNTGTERLLTYDVEAQRKDIEELKEKVEQNTMAINAEVIVRREADDILRSLITSVSQTVLQFDSRITANTTNISNLDDRLDQTVTSTDKAMPKSYIDGLVSGIYHIKGVVETVADLPATGNVTGDCYNVLEDGNTYIWTDNNEWVSGGATIDLSPYRKAADQDIIDASKQDKLTAGDYINISATNEISMTGKFGKSFSMSGKNLILKDQDNNTLSETIIGVGVDAEYTPATEDIKFDEGESGDYTFFQEQLDAINAKIPDDASSTNKLVTKADLDTKQNVLTAGRGIDITEDTISLSVSYNSTTKTITFA